MAELSLTYSSVTHHRIINVTYNDVAHAILGGSISEIVTTSGISPGTEFYRQTVGDDFWSVRAMDTAPYAYVVAGSTGGGSCDIDIDDVDIVAADSSGGGSVNVTASGTGTLRYNIGFGPQASNVFSGLPPGTYILIVTRLEDSCEVRQSIEVPYNADLEIQATATGLSVADADDGSILVEVLAGSGNYIFEIVDPAQSEDTDDGVESHTFTNLPIGLYLIKVTDEETGQIKYTQVEVLQPAINITEPIEGSVFRFSPINSIRFVRQNDDEVPTLDNRLLCQEVYPGYSRTNYFQKLNQSDAPPIQFDSNYGTHVVELRNYKTGAVVETFEAEVKEQNLGTTQTFPVTLRDHGVPGKTRVYFTAGTFPIPVIVGQVVEIQNTVSMNGTFQVTAIELDEDLGYEYMLINKNYVGGVTVPGDGVFDSTAVDFNVWEFTPDLSEVDPGEYYFQITPKRAGGSITDDPAISEPILLKESHTGTVAIIYSCVDNAFGATFSTGYRGFVRIPSRFGPKRFVGGVNTVVRDNADNIVKTSAKRRRRVELEIMSIPPYLHELLALVFGCDFFSINGVAFQTEDEYPEPKYIDRFVLANAAIRVEQLDWFPTYNSDNTVAESCTCETLELANVSTSLSTLSLDLKRMVQRYFTASPIITGNKSIDLVNDGLALAWKLRLEVNSGGLEFTFPDECVMSSGEWNDSTKIWTPSEAGIYEIEAMWDGSNWLLKTAFFPSQASS